MRAKELQAPGGMGGDELFQKQPAEHPREHAHRQEEARPAGYPPSGRPRKCPRPSPSAPLAKVRFRGQSGKLMLAVRFTRF